MTSPPRRPQDIGLDPDPLTVELQPVVIRCRRCGAALRFGRIGLCDDCVGRGDGNAVVWVVLAFLAAVVIGLAIAIVLVAAPRSAALLVSPPDRQSTGAPPIVLGTGREIARPQLEAGPGGAPQAQLAPPLEVIRGTATHYCLPGQRGTAFCTRGYGPEDLVAAIDTDLGFSKGDRVVVRSLAGPESVTVRIVDVCGCPGERLIDLTSGAFRRLAPLGLGVIPVTVELAGTARTTLPPTETAP